MVIYRDQDQPWPLLRRKMTTESIGINSWEQNLQCVVILLTASLLAEAEQMNCKEHFRQRKWLSIRLVSYILYGEIINSYVFNFTNSGLHQLRERTPPIKLTAAAEFQSRRLAFKLINRCFLPPVPLHESTCRI